MTVRDLIAALQKEDPDALVVFWPDPHESSGYDHASGVRRVWVKPGPPEMHYEHEPRGGYVPAIEVV